MRSGEYSLIGGCGEPSVLIPPFVGWRPPQLDEIVGDVIHVTLQ
jgi:hypothetical protein